MQETGSYYNAGLRGLSQDTNGNVSLGDVITAIDGEKMGDLDDLYRYLDKKQIGDTISVEVFRDGKTTKLPVKLLGSSTKPPAATTKRF